MSLSLEYKSKMEEAGANQAAIDSFLRAFDLLKNGASFMIPEAEISPAVTIPMMEDILQHDTENHAQYLSKTVVIKLNGGLGTGMGLQKAKSLLEIKDGNTFLDLIALQNESLREQCGDHVKFLLMNSFSTSADTLAYLKKYPLYTNAEDVEILQNFSPKILQKDKKPANHLINPDLDWCPPGHGDIYTSLYGSGWLDKLLSEGIQYAFISNSDNLGAFVKPELLSYFAKSGLPFLMEVTRRTQSDRKGGHLCERKDTGGLLLREVAQCPDEDLAHFQDISKHQFFNTNNLWLDLQKLKETMSTHGGILPLPIITNKKTHDPRDKSSAPVYQLETAMGAAIDCFEGAGAVCVPRSRFAPVKTTADLLALRSDVYETLENGCMTLIPERNGKPPVIKLSEGYKLIGRLATLGIPSLKHAESLTIEGNVTFEKNVIILGVVKITNSQEETLVIPSGTYENVTLDESAFLIA